MIRKTFCIFLLVLGCGLVQAQTPAKYWVQFRDKAGTPFSIERPEEFLSPRAIALRQLHRIPIEETDLPVNPDYVQRVLSLDSSMRLCVQSRWQNAITVYVDREEVMDQVRQLSFVQAVERTIALKAVERDSLPAFRYVDDGAITHTYALDVLKQGDFAYGKSERQIRLNGAHWLHRMGYRGENMQVMVLDGGFSHADTLTAFETLRRDHRLLGARNLVVASENPFLEHTHGTSVLSCMATYMPGVLVGSSPMAQFYLCQTEDGRSEHKIEEDNWVAGIELADSLGCQVLNSSLGYTEFDDSLQRRTYADMNGKVSRASQAAAMAVAKGMIVCNSAGNEGGKAWAHIGAPADSYGILAVGAVTHLGRLAYFSSHGPSFDGRVKPDVCAVGDGTWTVNATGRVTQSSGTSFSSPLFAGMVTCLWQAFPEKSNVEVMEAVRQSGSRYDNPDSLMGNGIPDLLKAYNLLRQPKLSKSSVLFDSFVAEYDTLFFKIQTKFVPEVKLLSSEKFAKKVRVYSFLTEDGSLQYAVVLPKLKSKEVFRMADLEIVVGDETCRYRVAQERPIPDQFANPKKRK